MSTKIVKRTAVFISIILSMLMMSSLAIASEPDQSVIAQEEIQSTWTVEIVTQEAETFDDQ